MGAYARFLARLERTRTLGMSLGVERVEEALAQLGDPHRRLRAIHIAGTNGKGSTAAMCASILRAAGVRVGLYTSPHLCRFTERIRIDDREIDGERLAALDERVAATGVPLTYFETATVLAFLAFEDVEVGVLETGLGGRLDATNVCRPLATAITSIARDHTELLGETLAQIAGEKAGIAKAGVPLFLGALPAEADARVEEVARAVGAPVRRLGPDFGLPPAAPGLAGPHQRANAALAVALAREASAGRLSDEVIAAGLREVRWPGRLELVNGVLFDGAHNAEGAAALVAALPPARPRVLVISVVRGKPLAEMIQALAGAFDHVIATRSRNERALDPHVLAAPLNAAVQPDPGAALAAARAIAGADGLVVVAGSLFLVGELRCQLLGEASDPVGGDPVP